MSTYYSLRVGRLEELKWKHRFYRGVPRLYAEVELGGTTRKTKTIEGAAPSWNEALMFPYSSAPGHLRIAVKHKSYLPNDVCVGIAEIHLSDLLANPDVEVSLDLLSPKRAPMITGRIFLLVKVVDATEAASASIAEAKAGVQQRAIVQSGGASKTTELISNAGAEVERHGELYEAVGELLERLKGLEPVMNTLSEIHPFVKVAWSLTSTLYNAVRNVFEADRKVIELVQTMADAFDFVQDVEKLQDRAATLQKPIDGLLKQTIECCIFVRDYTSHGFAGRMSETDATRKIDEFQQSLESFKKEIDSGVALHTAFVSTRTAQVVDKLLLHQLLNPSQFDAFDRSDCLPGTRLEIMDKIINWMFSETDQNIFWLHGAAGSGKSTVSMTIASHFRQMSRLGAFLFFERGKSEPSSVIRTIAYKLALHDASICAKIVTQITNDPDIIGASSIEQFKKLLLHPLAAAGSSMPGPVVVVLDALDECGSPESRRGLMALLRNEFLKLPNSFRFLITSRREEDIDFFLSSQHGTVRTEELDHASDGSRRDVSSFVHTELNVVKGLVRVPEGWPWDENVRLLGSAADGLFIWASTAVKMIKNSDDRFFQFDSLVSDRRLLGGDLSVLYATALRSSGIDWTSKRSKERFEKVMGLLLFGKVPMTIQAMDDFLGFEIHESSELLLSRLRSLIACSREGTVSLLHASFSDFLTSPEPSGESWFVDADTAQRFISERCFTIMESKLQFNICGLESSFVRNVDVPGLADRIKSRIPSHLEYACVHWSRHLVEAPHTSELLGMLTEFANHRLLFWFEVLSLTKMFGRVAPTSLSEAVRWTQEPNIASFLEDAKKPVSMFATAIIESAAHIYVSMIPFSEDDSKFAAHYSTFMSSKIRVVRVGDKRPPLCLRVFEGHSHDVKSVAFSPNGRHVASAFNNGTVRMWDIDSGEEIFEPWMERTACFSPDGGRIVSGSYNGELRVWDARNGKLVLGPLEGNTRWVRSVTWSPDGTMIASGSGDETIILWNAADGKSIFRLCGHTGSVSSVAFSRDSARLASGSADRTIRIWDLKSGQLAFGPFEGHSNYVLSVAFSPDGRHVVSGSYDETIKIWEVESGSVVWTLEGHTNWVTSVAYFPCGTRIVSGSHDKTIRVWDAKSGRMLSTLEGHTNWVNAVAVSPDGRYIASGSDDATVRIWDATTASNSKASTKHSHYITSVASSPDGRRIASASLDESVIVWDAKTGDAEFTLHGHTDGVNCVAFVPDGSQLISSGSWDKTVRIWDTETGESASEPLMHTGHVNSVAVSPDGLTVAYGNSDGMITVWSIATGRLVAGPLQGHSYRVNSIAFSLNGKRLASGSNDKKVIIWNTDDWATKHEPLTSHSSSVMSVCFSSDGSRIASGSFDNKIIIWDAESGQKVAGPFEGHASSVSSIVFSLDRRHLISGSWDCTMRVWDAQSGRTTCELRGHTAGVCSLALSPDGCRIISGSVDKTIRVWDLSDVLQLRGERTGDVEILFSEWDLGENGWILGGRERRDLLAWIPPDLRATLCRPRNTAILGCDYSTKLDFTGAALGERWTECFVSSSGSGS